MKKNILKRITVSLLCFIFLFTFNVTVYAEDAVVSYSTSAKKFEFSPESTDLFQNFKGVMPGDVLTQTFSVNNAKNSNKTVKIYLRAKAVEGKEEYNDFLSKITLTVTQNGQENPLFDDKANAQGTLAQNVLLGTFYPGADISFNVNIKVPIEIGNEFQDMTGKVTWIFTAAHDEYNGGGDGGSSGDTSPEPEEVEDVVIIEDELTPMGKPDLGSGDKRPQTGDNANIVLPIALMSIAFLLMLAIVFTGKKNRNKK